MDIENFGSCNNISTGISCGPLYDEILWNQLVRSETEIPREWYILDCILGLIYVIGRCKAFYYKKKAEKTKMHHTAILQETYYKNSFF